MQKIKCNICDIDDTVLLFQNWDRYYNKKEKLFNIVRCNRCGLIYINPQPTHEQLSEYYPDNYIVYNDGDGRFKYDPISKLLHKFSKHKRIKKIETIVDESVMNYLDFGCAGGSHLINIRERHPKWNIEGFDNNYYACRQATAKGFKVYCGNIENIVLPVGHYDIVHMGQVIEHLIDPNLTLISLNRAMKIGGQLIISTPNGGSNAARIFKKYWYGLDTPRHTYIFSKNNICKILEGSGFVVTKIKYRQDPKYLITSVYYLFNRKDLSINPFMWRIFIMLNKFLSFRDKQDIIKIEASKVTDL